MLLPAFTVADFDSINVTTGISAFIMGSVAVLGGGFLEWLIWAANPLFFLSMILARRKNNNAIIFGWLAFIIAVSFAFWTQILAAENGRMGTIESKGAGYILWVMALAIWTFGISFNYYNPE